MKMARKHYHYLVQGGSILPVTFFNNLCCGLITVLSVMRGVNTDQLLLVPSKVITHYKISFLVKNVG